MTKSDDDDIVFDAATGRRISRDGKIVELFPSFSIKPVPVPDEPPSLVERMTIRADLPASLTIDEACDRAAQEELAALPARIAQVVQSDDDDI